MRKTLFLCLLLASAIAGAQSPGTALNSAEIHQAIKKLNFLGSVLYVAAHPDDENTRLISYFSNEVHARTGYLSVTRGDGGQNLIGPELKESLGVIRTQELLEARKIDGGEQFFTNAIDFGYTKTPEEALEIWEEEKVLGDMVWVFRNFKPDVVINRFDHRTAGETHGQHTASALLSLKAFRLTGDPKAYPEQLRQTASFSPTRIFFNTSPWFYSSQQAFEEAGKSEFLKFETGVYFPSRGLSNPEIAAKSRSQHRSQGFGSIGSRGRQAEYLEPLQEELSSTDQELFAGIDTSWKRVKGGEEIGRILKKVEDGFDFTDPSASLSALVQAYSLIQKLEDTHWKKIKTEEIKEIIAACAGLYLEAVVRTGNATPSQTVSVALEAINRSSAETKLVSVNISPGNTILPVNEVLQDNEDWKQDLKYQLPATLDYTNPYWLDREKLPGRYRVENLELTGLPEAPPAIYAEFLLNIYDTPISFKKPLVYKYADPVEGEVYEPFNILPAVSVEIPESILIFPDDKAKNIRVKVTAHQPDLQGELKLEATGKWKVIPKKSTFSLKEKGSSQMLDFEVTPPRNKDQALLKPVATVNNLPYEKEVKSISYRHIPGQALIRPAETSLVRLAISKKGNKLGYIEGAGDKIPESLEQIGYSVTRISAGEITEDLLNQFDAVILGIRAYNVAEELKYKQQQLHNYVRNGGTLIVQYNTSRGLVTDQLAPYRLELSRDRVTEEDAEVTILAADHPLINFPNKITKEDFKGWVQERGLYFPDTWAPEFTPVLSMNDSGESPRQGSLLTARYGKGHFIYTGLSFFRQLPEGVPGAYRLFANMISIGK